ncbi:MipA/OmpV family protein [Sphingomonas sp.]|jgi:outer membrane scaffolding protein for murein synthesis (MipA/OmpV family)|uniref:MipA/OmpV family protein n=1 Tax=Sphingomonas sp. TaxID=28214 RepID=UPI002D7F5CD5|nr:MipA/OmpV family protein [Sphingomonas sp.]HEU0045761.1 MipA/OmpV family protein [Sphingomonas sp.]
MVLRPLALALVALATPAQAQEDERPRRTRVALGPQLVPSYPGADGHSLRPLFDLSRARGDDDFAFEAPDESFGFPLLRADRFQFGPSLGFEGERSAKDVGVAVPKVGFTVEAGGFVQYLLTPALRLRGELRHGIGGHKGLVGTVGADLVTRDRDRWLFSIGPRVTLANDRYHRAYFGITPAAAAATGLPAFDAKGGVQAVGLTAGALRQLTQRWGLYGYAKYDRLVGDSARSPLVRRFGARDQLSGGLALSYTFGR